MHGLPVSCPFNFPNGNFEAAMVSYTGLLVIRILMQKKKKKKKLNIHIKRDFLKHKTVKTNDKIRRFGVFMTPLSRKILKRSCKLQYLKRFWREELTKEGAKIVKIF